MFIFSRKTTALLAFVSLMMVSCQASTVDAQSSSELRRVEELVKSTPPLYKVSWKVCGVEKIVAGA